MLVAMIAMYFQAGTTDIAALLNHTFASGHDETVAGFTIVGGVQTLLWLAFFASFAVKMPMWPVHTWLPGRACAGPPRRVGPRRPRFCWKMGTAVQPAGGI